MDISGIRLAQILPERASLPAKIFMTLLDFPNIRVSGETLAPDKQAATAATTTGDATSPYRYSPAEKSRLIEKIAKVAKTLAGSRRLGGAPIFRTPELH